MAVHRAGWKGCPLLWFGMDALRPDARQCTSGSPRLGFPEHPDPLAHALQGFLRTSSIFPRTMSSTVRFPLAESHMRCVTWPSGSRCHVRFPTESYPTDASLSSGSMTSVCRCTASNWQPVGCAPRTIIERSCAWPNGARCAPYALPPVCSAQPSASADRRLAAHPKESREKMRTKVRTTNGAAWRFPFAVRRMSALRAEDNGLWPTATPAKPLMHSRDAAGLTPGGKRSTMASVGDW